MYKLPYFTEEDGEKVIGFVKEYPFAVIAGPGNEYPVATHIPLEIIIRENNKVSFTGHLMKNTDHHQAFEMNENVLVIFNGPHSFVSASWYTTQNVASTWNYMTVHAKGKIKFTDEKGTYNAIKVITDKYEGFDTPASFDKLSDDYINRLMKAIIAFEIEVVSFENVFKLSQNHNEQTRKNIAKHLAAKEDEGSKKIGQEIEKRLENRQHGS